jgi:hypothetical protein
MPPKKTDKAESSKSKRTTAPVVPNALIKQINIENSTDQSTTNHHVAVRKIPPKESDQNEVETSTIPPANNIDNAETDKAVDDIMANESDTLLAVDDAIVAKRSVNTKEPNWRDKLFIILRSKWTWIGIAVILCFLFALPYSRYKLLGVLIKERVQITILDSQTHTPVSNAQVSTAGASVKTDADGKVELRAGVGERTLIITKQYYRTATTHYFIGFKANKPVTIKLFATGRLIPITVLNTISGKPLPGAVINMLATTAKTNSKGQATIAVPAGSSHDSAKISLAGYNSKQVSVQVTSFVSSANSFNLTPAGTIYFLSSQSGTIDVMKSNLDGTGRQTVLAGTGHEVASTTRLIASRDWHYLALEANRDGSRAALYLIDASNGQSTEFDSSNSIFSPLGWQGHTFIYSLKSVATNQWQSGSQVVKGYDAEQRQLNQIDQNQALGNSSSYADQNFTNFFIISGELIYDTQWSAQGGYDLSNENDTIRIFQFSTQSKKDAESFHSANIGSIQASRYQPQAIYFEVPNTSDSTNTFYQYSNQTVQTASIDQTTFDQSNPNYYESPSGNHTAWATLSNGQDLFLIGDNNAGSQHQIAALNNYSPYGWFTDNYVIASRSNSQLYILPASGLSGAQQPYKINSYYEPSASQSNYEYGGF